MAPAWPSTLAAALLVVAALRACLAQPPGALVLDGFQLTTVFAGLQYPTALRVAPDGRVVVLEKYGAIKLFKSMADADPPVVLLDIGYKLDSIIDRGLLSAAFRPLPDAAGNLELFIGYSYFVGGGPCVADPCVTNNRVSRLRITPGNALAGPEEVILEGLWCQSFLSHSFGNLLFQGQNALLLTAGEGASYTDFDVGNLDGNACGDAPGGALTLPTAEGGALRSQHYRSGQAPWAARYEGTLLRVDPDTGAALPDNPGFAGAANPRSRVVAYGFRNPFRGALRPGTNEWWTGDVGWMTWESIYRHDLGAGVFNGGWPCFEGPDVSPYAGLVPQPALCTSLYAAPGGRAAPFFAYAHAALPNQDGKCLNPNAAASGTGSSVSAISFVNAPSYPAAFQGALAFADMAAGCSYIMLPGAGGDPDVGQILTLANGLGIVDMQAPEQYGGLLHLVDFNLGAVYVLTYGNVNPIAPVTARFTASVAGGAAPLTVTFDATTSQSGAAIAVFAWDLDGDGAFGDAVGAVVTFTFAVPGQYAVRLQATDVNGATGTSPATAIVVAAVGAPPPAILAPDPDLLFAVNDVIQLQGAAGVPGSTLAWTVEIRHCPPAVVETCHRHILANKAPGDQFQFTVPDHGFFFFFTIMLQATSPEGLVTEATLALQPALINIVVNSIPAGLRVRYSLDDATGLTPYAGQAVVNSVATFAAPLQALVAGVNYAFQGWSVGGATPTIQVLLAGDIEITALYAPA